MLFTPVLLIAILLAILFPSLMRAIVVCAVLAALCAYNGWLATPAPGLAPSQQTAAAAPPRAGCWTMSGQLCQSDR